MKPNLFNHMDREYNMTLTNSELDEISDAVHRDDEESKRQELARNTVELERILKKPIAKNLSEDFGGMS